MDMQSQWKITSLGQLIYYMCRYTIPMYIIIAIENTLFKSSLMYTVLSLQTLVVSVSVVVCNHGSSLIPVHYTRTGALFALLTII